MREHLPYLTAIFIGKLVYEPSKKLNQTAAMNYCELQGGSLPIISNKDDVKMLHEKSKY